MTLTKTLPKAITKILEDNGFWFNDIECLENANHIEFGQCTPLGEDWYVCLWIIDTNNIEADFKASLYAYIDSYDVDEECELWIDGRGKNGVPNSIKALVEDAEWKLETLKELYEDLSKEEV